MIQSRLSTFQWSKNEQHFQKHLPYVGKSWAILYLCKGSDYYFCLFTLFKWCWIPGTCCYCLILLVDICALIRIDPRFVESSVVHKGLIIESIYHRLKLIAVMFVWRVKFFETFWIITLKMITILGNWKIINSTTVIDMITATRIWRDWVEEVALFWSERFRKACFQIGLTLKQNPALYL